MLTMRAITTLKLYNLLRTIGCSPASAWRKATFMYGPSIPL